MLIRQGHTFLYSPAVRKIKEIVQCGDMERFGYICARQFKCRCISQKEHQRGLGPNMAPHDISIVSAWWEMVHVMNCQGSAHILPAWRM